METCLLVPPFASKHPCWIRCRNCRSAFSKTDTEASTCTPTDSLSSFDGCGCCVMFCFVLFCSSDSSIMVDSVLLSSSLFLLSLFLLAISFVQLTLGSVAPFSSVWICYATRKPGGRNRRISVGCEDERRKTKSEADGR